MYNTDTHRLQSEVAELRFQLIRCQAEIRALRSEVTSQWEPWSSCMRLLDGLPFVMMLMTFLVLAHGFK